MQKIIDTHNHLWILNERNFSWITDELAKIKKDFELEDLKDLLSKNNIAGSLLVQVQPEIEETEWLIGLARMDKRIKGVIGWVDVTKGKEVEAGLDRLMFLPGIVKGIRYMSQGLPPEHLHTKKFIEGINCIGKKGLVYELLITHHQLKAAEKLISQCPETTFVIDHIAKPDIASGKINSWYKDLTSIAEKYNNVYCKLSGMVTEANWNNWKKEEIYPYISAVVNSFGDDRVVFGSDWPVSLLAAEYNQVVDLVESWLEANPEISSEKTFLKNAQVLYGLE